MRDMKDDYPFHRGYEEVLGQRDGQRALRRETQAAVPARAGPWDFFMIALGAAACTAYSVAERPAGAVATAYHALIGR